MNLRPPRHAITAGVAASALLLGFSALTLRAADEETGVVSVKLGTTIARSWDQVKADKFAYGPKQEFDAASGETHVWLPYGNNSKFYSEVRGTLYDASETGLAKFHSADGSTNALLVYKLQFDKPVSAFRFTFGGLTELGLAANTVAGIEYSADGKSWTTIKEVKGADKGPAMIEPFVKDFKADKLNTQTLFIRVYSRDPQNPDGSGEGRWLQFRMTGDPQWGDAAYSFFNSQPQIWVK